MQASGDGEKKRKYTCILPYSVSLSGIFNTPFPQFLLSLALYHYTLLYQMIAPPTSGCESERGQRISWCRLLHYCTRGTSSQTAPESTVHIWGQLSSQKWYLCNTSVKKPARCTVSCSSEKCAFPCMWLQGPSFSEPCAVQCADVFYIQTSGACYASDPAWKCINPYFKTCTSVNSTVQVP